MRLLHFNPGHLRVALSFLEVRSRPCKTPEPRMNTSFVGFA